MVSSWEILNPPPNGSAIAQGLDFIPPQWDLTPVCGKCPAQPHWASEPPVPRETIKTGIKERLYTGYGLKLGDSSDGLLALNVNSKAGHRILLAMAQGDLPDTVSFSSGKPHCFQLLFAVPDEHRNALQHISRKRLTQCGNVAVPATCKGEPAGWLGVRYNRCQSVVPASWHPETGDYQWRRSPQDAAVAIAPAWLLDWLLELSLEAQLKTEFGGNEYDPKNPTK